jgi:hypothetical protein
MTAAVHPVVVHWVLDSCSTRLTKRFEGAAPRGHAIHYFRSGDPAKRKLHADIQGTTVHGRGGFYMEKPHAKLGKSSKGTDDAQFERFLEAARKRGVNESLEDFAVKYGAIAPLQQPTKRAE